MAVRRRTHDGGGGDIAGGARQVLDHERLAETIRQPLPEKTRGGVGPAAAGLADDDAHRPRRIGLRPRRTDDCGQRRRGRREVQQCPARKFHWRPPELFAIRCSQSAQSYFSGLDSVKDARISAGFALARLEVDRGVAFKHVCALAKDSGGESRGALQWAI